jgi:RNA polymerase sigma-70 factor (ECF subfamily)
VKAAGKLRLVEPADPGPRRLTDEELLAAAAAGDMAALGALYDRHHGTVARFLGQLAHVDRADVGDLVHDVFLGVHRTATAFRGGSSVRTWILSIAANVARDRARAAKRRRFFAGLLARRAPAEVERPDQAFAANEGVLRLRRALAELSVERASAFLLADVEELPCAEVAAVLGAPVGTVYRWLHEARTTLRRAVAADDGEGRGER